MISTLTGRVTEIGENALVVEVGGVGLQVSVPAPLCDEIQPGQPISLHTRLVVRENDLSLYGFGTHEQREYFDLLLAVNGVGPRLALAILSTLDPDAIRRAVFSEAGELLSRVPGVGKKTAQKIALHLQDRLPQIEGLEPVAAMDEKDSEVLAALTSLGYSVVEAQAAVQSLPKDAPDDIEERLRLSLRYFSR